MTAGPESWTEAVKLIEDGLFLRMYGERPPGAPPGRPQAETWRDWDQRAEMWLRARHERDGAAARHQDRGT